jgi:hypothetical protein
MWKKSYSYIVCLGGLVAFNGCKKPYLPPIINTSTNYLVVEGVINSGADSTVIKLSRTVNISGTVVANPELNAKVTVESDANTTYALQELGKGGYGSAGLNLDNSHKYHLHIFTSSGKEYLSDFEAVKTTPPIDSVGFIQQSNGINLYVNTHDPNNNTRYYRWDYTETWNFHAEYAAAYITDGTKLSIRTPAQQIYSCFAGNPSSNILLGSSAALAQDNIFQSPLTQIASTSEKLEAKYSILVKQYALSNDAYNFWQNLKKNTEQLGSIFDAQPSEVPGNIHCVTTPAEPVIGYVSVGTVSQKRIFISNTQLPLTWVPTYPYQCELDTFLYARQGQNDVALFLIPLNYSALAITPVSINGNALGFFGADPECADCTIRGTTVQPPFWK